MHFIGLFLAEIGFAALPTLIDLIVKYFLHQNIEVKGFAISLLVYSFILLANTTVEIIRSLGDIITKLLNLGNTEKVRPPAISKPIPSIMAIATILGSIVFGILVALTSLPSFIADIPLVLNFGVTAILTTIFVVAARKQLIWD